jgi:hypothetical protein
MVAGSLALTTPLGLAPPLQLQGLSAHICLARPKRSSETAEWEREKEPLVDTGRVWV